MALVNAGAKVLKTGVLSAAGVTVLPQLDDTLSHSLLISGGLLLSLIIGLKLAGIVRRFRQRS